MVIYIVKKKYISKISYVYVKSSINHENLITLRIYVSNNLLLFIIYKKII